MVEKKGRKTRKLSLTVDEDDGSQARLLQTSGYNHETHVSTPMAIKEDEPLRLAKTPVEAPPRFIMSMPEAPPHNYIMEVRAPESLKLRSGMKDDMPSGGYTSPMLNGKSQTPGSVSGPLRPPLGEKIKAAAAKVAPQTIASLNTNELPLTQEAYTEFRNALLDPIGYLPEGGAAYKPALVAVGESPGYREAARKLGAVIKTIKFNESVDGCAKFLAENFKPYMKDLHHNLTLGIAILHHQDHEDMARELKRILAAYESSGCKSQMDNYMLSVSHAIGR